MDNKPLPTELRLAAIITLLSSSAIRGATACKSNALRIHLEAAAFATESLHPQLRTALENTLAEWMTIECHPQSVAADFCVLASSGQAYH